MFETLGKPGPEDLTFVKTESAKKFIDKLPNTPKTSIAKIIPDFPNKQAIDLIDKMLEINPLKRINA
jgi:hypothetical protein